MLDTSADNFLHISLRQCAIDIHIYVAIVTLLTVKLSAGLFL